MLCKAVNTNAVSVVSLALLVLIVPAVPLHVPALRAVPVVLAAPSVLVVLAVPDVLARLDNDHDWISGSPGLSGYRGRWASKRGHVEPSMTGR